MFLNSKTLKRFCALFGSLFLTACTDYVQQMEDDHDEWCQRENSIRWDDYLDSNSTGGVVDPASIETGFLVDSRESKVYRTVKIGKQVWMAENLNYEGEGSYCYTKWGVSYCDDRYGRLYTWYAAVGKKESECGAGFECVLPSVVQGVCPDGWRMPSKEDFEILFEAVGGTQVAGKKLKFGSLWNGDDGENLYSFSVVPAGKMVTFDSYDYDMEYAFFWTMTQVDLTDAVGYFFEAGVDGVGISSGFKTGEGRSVRCIQNETGLIYPVIRSSSSAAVQLEPSSSFSYSLSSSGSYSSSAVVEAPVCGDMWCGPNHDYRVETEFEYGDGYSGYWFSYTDHAEGGSSVVGWPVARGTEWSSEAFDPVIDYCDGICGTFALDKGVLTYDPFVGLGFNVAGTDGGMPVPANASAWGGVCVVYYSNVDIVLEMGLGDEVDAALGYDTPIVIMRKSSASKVVEYAWSEFRQAGWGGKDTISGDEASKTLAQLKFKFQAENGTTGDYNIVSVGRYGTCK